MPFDKRLSHHEGREGHEERITERTSNPKKNGFFLRALRVLRGDIHFSFGCGSDRSRIFVVKISFIMCCIHEE